MTLPIRAVHALGLDYPPDCVEFLPEHPQHCIIGTYHLQQDQTNEEDGNVNRTEPYVQRRNGQLVLCAVVDNKLANITQVETAGGAYDLHFHPKHHDVLGVATSTGRVSLYLVTAHSITLLKHHRLTDEHILITSFAWHPDPAKSTNIVTTDSEGKVIAFNLLSLDSGTSSGSSSPISPQHAPATELARHDEAAWHASWTSFGQQVLHGGDDAVLGWVDISSHDGDHEWSLFNHVGDDESHKGLQIYRDRRVHGAGVTAVLLLLGRWILSGSYDDHLRILQLPKHGTKVVEGSRIKFDDGVFRLRILRKTEPSTAYPRFSAIILASCMRAGTRILRLGARSTGSSSEVVDLVDWSIDMLATFTENESLNYAAAYSNGNIVSVSFYDKRAFLWKYDITTLDD